MARLYVDEDFDFKVVVELRRLGHDLLTVQDAGRGNQRISDDEVLAFAISQVRVVLTFNRRDLINLHRSAGSHQGIIVCTRDVDAAGLAGRIDQALLDSPDLRDALVRINRPQNL